MATIEVVAPAEIEPGGTATVEIVVSGLSPGEPARKVNFQGTATLDTGEVLSGPGVVNLKAKPAVTVTAYELLNTDGAGAVIEQDAGNPALFRVTVP